jgi:hypothetical protein
MIEARSTTSSVSRRRFLRAGGATVLAAGMPAMARAGQSDPTPRYLRRSVADPSAAPAIASYKKAVQAMLALPPSDPRNWYRNAFIHLLDCPHGNWWFLPWHRGYLGWFEQTCRTLSGDNDFALPYWDWTASPAIPAPFAADDVLNPGNGAFVGSFDALRGLLGQAIGDYYGALSTDQRDQLDARRMGSPDAFWARAGGAFPADGARNPSTDADWYLAAVSIDTIRDCLTPASFLDFASGKVAAHSDVGVEHLLESGPHDNTHGAVGGLMGAYLSPIDPVFFLHHANIDRLWDVWTRKQVRAGLPTLPAGQDLTDWQNEPFLFYVGPDGKPVARTKAGDYAAIGDFGYGYQPGSGEEVVQAATRQVRRPRETFAARLSRSTLDFHAPTMATAQPPQALLAGGDRRLFARVTLVLPTDPVGTHFHILVNPPQGRNNLHFSDPSFAGTISPFGNHDGGHAGKTVSFEVPISTAVKKLIAAGRMKPGDPINVRVVPDTRGITLIPFATEIKSVTIGTI